MNALGHVPCGAAFGATVAYETGLPLWQRLATVFLAAATSMIPDIDNTKPWKKLAKHTPTDALNHRRITHSWLIPFLLYRSDHTWTMIAIVTGLASHVVMDAIFGEGGVPMFLWFARFGLHLPMGGALEVIVAVAAAVYVLPVLAVGPHFVGAVANAVGAL